MSPKYERTVLEAFKASAQFEASIMEAEQRQGALREDSHLNPGELVISEFKGKGLLLSVVVSFGVSIGLVLSVFFFMGGK